ncbi:type II toxin-antitoxin system VapB15 family antitoxin [Aquiflexum sp.]|uniref:type II toxin-antitoxin system VapB15 family antitoxin n=1 Tax=Aquiflexum sp. TaxID=1872584 RepID=UPI0035930B84
MKTEPIQSPSYKQVVDLVKQLNTKEKIQLTEMLEKEILDYKLSDLLKSFKTDEISQQDIDDEVEKVRLEIYERKR